MANYYKYAVLDVTNVDRVGVGLGGASGGDDRIVVGLGGTPTPQAVEGELDGSHIDANWIALTPAAAKSLFEQLENIQHMWKTDTPLAEAARITGHTVEELAMLPLFTVQVEGAAHVRLADVQKHFRVAEHLVAEHLVAEHLVELRARARENFPDAVFLPGDSPPPVGTRLIRTRGDGSEVPFPGGSEGIFDGEWKCESEESSMRYWWRIKIKKVTRKTPMSPDDFDILLEWPPYLRLANEVVDAAL